MKRLTDLNVGYPQVGDEVPAGRAVASVAIEAEAGSIVDGISWTTTVTGTSTVKHAFFFSDMSSVIRLCGTGSVRSKCLIFAVIL